MQDLREKKHHLVEMDQKSSRAEIKSKHVT